MYSGANFSLVIFRRVRLELSPQKSLLGLGCAVARVIASEGSSEDTERGERSQKSKTDSAPREERIKESAAPPADGGGRAVPVSVVTAW